MDEIMMPYLNYLQELSETHTVTLYGPVVPGLDNWLCKCTPRKRDWHATGVDTVNGDGPDPAAAIRKAYLKINPTKNGKAA